MGWKVHSLRRFVQTTPFVHFVSVHCSLLQFVTVYRSLSQCNEIFCLSALQFVSVRYSLVSAINFAALFCIVDHNVDTLTHSGAVSGR